MKKRFKLKTNPENILDYMFYGFLLYVAIMVLVVYPR